MNDTIIRSRIDSAVKSEAVKIFNSMGLSMSDAIRLFLHQVISKQALPFSIEAPNNVTVRAMEAVRRGENLETVTLQQLEKEWEEACGK
ncbi:MAG: type II toxin-antitoxin system RelB/DinJ family antitoxin [Desulfamplus sp.]|nr:type II toxin-antitoxin system RelB/DinJ family antitoxin [Desulfamplus sp.]